MEEATYQGPQVTVGNALVPTLGSEEEALVYQVGAQKHGAQGWRKGILWSVALTKMLRHLGKFLAGESRCPQDGQHHLASIKFWCNALMEYEQTHPELNDITLTSTLQKEGRKERVVA